MRVIIDGDAPQWAQDLARQVNATLDAGLPNYSVGRLPPAKRAGTQIYVTNETGGACVAYADGTTWRRVRDDVEVS